MNLKPKVLEVKNLRTTFRSNKKSFNAVDEISFHINEGETLGIVGESGCGKSVTSLSIMGLIKPPGEVNGDQVTFQDMDLLSLNKRKMRKIRGNQISMIFQEPMTSLNPVYRIGDQIGESIRIHEKVKGTKLKKRVVDLLKLVGIPRPEEIYANYPHQLSGGMSQRVMIAIAMACNPDLIIADEPTTALDVTIQAQILELMKSIQEERGMSIMLITHDLGVVSEVCDRMLVMYAGKIVESGIVEDVLKNPQHPYTKGLLDSLPKKGVDKERLNYIPGQVPSPLNWGVGCRFADRCSHAMVKCHEQIPSLIEIGNEQQAACWLVEEGGELDDVSKGKDTTSIRS
ncbi:ABC transporter ATP-binding protein [Aquibacillus sp. 3ASR75-11]|uniref:ABC transporter ATP-binding protein n=1 Tax=Terrihalobacillus insolitus TaxID=2950438 RepID=A0A9X4APV6_9BACI|nr:ABC transporter ATP-binding protein [Terrihalobacillus insolitus]MDC3413795.1 ABC transporter ATP-binding protein [Terrihalobacillus insolitus]MDC3425963.1 ABC transporter ATP-binding protein [Terrihalobacillus insolitus]